MKTDITWTFNKEQHAVKIIQVSYFLQRGLTVQQSHKCLMSTSQEFNHQLFNLGGKGLKINGTKTESGCERTAEQMSFSSPLMNRKCRDTQSCSTENTCLLVNMPFSFQALWHIINGVPFICTDRGLMYSSNRPFHFNLLSDKCVIGRVSHSLSGTPEFTLWRKKVQSWKEKAAFPLSLTLQLSLNQILERGWIIHFTYLSS